MNTKGEKAGYSNTIVGGLKRTCLKGALHFYKVNKKGRFLDYQTLANIYRIEKSLQDEIRRLKHSNKGTKVEDLR